MATSTDVRDILELDTGQGQTDFMTKESLMTEGKKVTSMLKAPKAKERIL